MVNLIIMRLTETCDKIIFKKRVTNTYITIAVVMPCDKTALHLKKCSYATK